MTETLGFQALAIQIKTQV